MNKDEALKLALEALKQCNIYAFAGGLGVRAMEHTEAMEAIKAALAQPEQELSADTGIPVTETETSGDYALGYAEGFNDACTPPNARTFDDYGNKIV